MKKCGYCITQRFPSDEVMLKETYSFKKRSGVFLSTGYYPTSKEWEEISLKPLKGEVDWSRNLIDLIRHTKYQLEKIDAVKEVFPELDRLVYELNNSALIGSEIYLIENIESDKPFKFNIFALRVFVETVEKLDIFRISNKTEILITSIIDRPSNFARKE